MKTPQFKPQNLGTKEGFKLFLEFEPEYLDPMDHFVGECGWSEEEYNSIKNFYWFSAKVVAYKGKVEAGCDHLGACCHKSLKDIMADGNIEKALGGYLPQMIEAAIEDAKQNLEI